MNVDAAMGVIDRAANRRAAAVHRTRRRREDPLRRGADDYPSFRSSVRTSIAQCGHASFEPRDCAVMYRTKRNPVCWRRPFCKPVCRTGWWARSGFYGGRRGQGRDRLPEAGAQPRRRGHAGPDYQTSAARRRRKDAAGAAHCAARIRSPPAASCSSLARGSDSPYWEKFHRAKRRAPADFGALLAGWTTAAPTLTVVELFDRVLKDLNYKK